MIDFEGIVSSDWHLRNDVPVCRPEDQEEWIDFQFQNIGMIQETAIEKDLDIYCIGDIYHRSQPYMGIIGRLKQAFDDFTNELYRLAGNHDLPYHSWDNVINSGWFLSPGKDILHAKKGAFHFGTILKKKKASIVFTHQLVFPDKKSMPPMAEGKTAQELLDEYPNAKWIFTGDYHRAFHYENGGRHVVNPGCLSRQSVGESEYDCGFYEVHTATNEVIFHSIGDTAVLKTAHLEKTKERDDRIDAFMEIIRETGKVTLSFTDNLNKKLLNKKIPQGTKSIVTEIEEELKKGVKK